MTKNWIIFLLLDKWCKLNEKWHLRVLKDKESLDDARFGDGKAIKGNYMSL